MERIKPRTLSGFMELLPAEQMKMEAIMAALRESYALYGFYPLDTPLIEASEILLAKGGGDTEKQIYRFTKGDTDLSLRFDLTVPLAKYVALNYGSLAFPFRRFQIGVCKQQVRIIKLRGQVLVDNRAVLNDDASLAQTGQRQHQNRRQQQRCQLFQIELHVFALLLINNTMVDWGCYG